MMSSTGTQIITIHILPNISGNEGNQIIKLGQLIKYNVRDIFFKNHAENEVVTLVPDLFCFLKKVLYEVKLSGQHFSFKTFCQSSTWTYNKSKPYELRSVDPEICLILIFQKRFWDQFLQHILCMIFQEKNFHVIFYQLIKFHCLIPFTSWDIGQYEYCNY